MAGSSRGLWSGVDYLLVPPSEVQNVPLGDGPVKGQSWHSIAKGERVLVVGDPGDVHRHLWEEARPYDPCPPS